MVQAFGAQQSEAQQFDIFSIDLRGHGKTTLPADPSSLHGFNTYGGDIAAFLDHEQREGWTVVGHSMGATASVLAAAGRSDIRAIKLIEPVIVPKIIRNIARLPIVRRIGKHHPMARNARRRRSQWTSVEEVYRRYAAKPVFKAWADGVLSDYLEDGLIRGENGVTLSCHPNWESATFAAQGHDFWGAFERLNASVSALIAKPEASTVSAGAREKLRSSGVFIEINHDIGHLVPMEKPALAADFIAQA